MTARSTIREVRAVVFSTTAPGTDAADAWEKVRANHCERLYRVSRKMHADSVVEHIGPVMGGTPSAMEYHPFRDVLIGIALGAEIEWNPCASSPNKPAEWRRVGHDSVLRDIGNGDAVAGEYRVKS